MGLIGPDLSALTVSGVTLVVDESLAPGLHAWGFDPPLAVDDIDGVAVRSRKAMEVAPAEGVLALDHVVVMSPEIRRTSTALERATGAGLRRIRDAGGGVEQAFHKMNDVVVEIVSAPRAECAVLWGVVFVVADLDAHCAQLGPDVIAPPRAAVQPGRRIATFRSAAALGVPVALMTPGG